MTAPDDDGQYALHPVEHEGTERWELRRPSDPPPPAHASAVVYRTLGQALESIESGEAAALLARMEAEMRA